jgi:hypothetical protein
LKLKALKLKAQSSKLKARRSSPMKYVSLSLREFHGAGKAEGSKLKGQSNSEIITVL